MEASPLTAGHCGQAAEMCSVDSPEPSKQAEAGVCGPGATDPRAESLGRSPGVGVDRRCQTQLASIKATVGPLIILLVSR